MLINIMSTRDERGCITPSQRIELNKRADLYESVYAGRASLIGKGIAVLGVVSAVSREIYQRIDTSGFKIDQTKTVDPWNLAILIGGTAIGTIIGVMGNVYFRFEAQNLRD